MSPLDVHNVIAYNRKPVLPIEHELLNTNGDNSDVDVGSHMAKIAKWKKDLLFKHDKNKGNDCGFSRWHLFATSLSLGKEPSMTCATFSLTVYDNVLLSCLESRVMTLFPSHKRKKNRQKPQTTEIIKYLLLLLLPAKRSRANDTV